MVSTVSGSDFITLREPISKNSTEKSTGFKDALHKAETTEREHTEAKEQETDSVEGDQGKDPAESGVQNAAAGAAGMAPWMSVLWSQLKSTEPGQQAVSMALTAEGAVQEMGKEMIAVPEQGVPFAQEQTSQKPDALQQSLFGSEMATVEKAGQQEGPNPVVQQNGGEAPGVGKKAEEKKQPELLEKTAAKEKNSAPGIGEDESRREEAFVTGLEPTAGKAAAEQTQFRSQSQGVSENKLVSSENQVKETATIEELPQRILSGIRENRAEFEIQIEPEALGKLTIKASYQEGKAVISILCSNTKTAEILSAHARDLGAIMEANLGHPTEIMIDRSAQENQGQDYPDGHAGGRGQREEESGRRQQKKESESFLQQLRLGLV